jgi:ABC-type Fe3+ transport system permease subunit
VRNAFPTTELNYNYSGRPSQEFDGSSMKITLPAIGLLIGGIAGFLLRPSVPFMGQLPFGTVIRRGANLHGLDQLLVGYARTSFNYLIAGMLLGVVIGLIAAFVISSQHSERTICVRPPS